MASVANVVNRSYPNGFSAFLIAESFDDALPHQASPSSTAPILILGYANGQQSVPVPTPVIREKAPQPSMSGLLPTKTRPAPFRLWTDATGKFSTRASLVEVRESKVYLAKVDGRLIAVPLEKLSKTDLTYLDRMNKQAKSAATKKPPTVARINRPSQFTADSFRKPTKRPEPAYTPPSDLFSSSLSEQSSSDDADEITVYVTETGGKYHRAGCQYLRKSSSPISLDAADASYTPCSRCHPPTL